MGLLSEIYQTTTTTTSGSQHQDYQQLWIIDCLHLSSLQQFYSLYQGISLLCHIQDRQLNAISGKWHLEQWKLLLQHSPSQICKREWQGHKRGLVCEMLIWYWRPITLMTDTFITSDSTSTQDCHQFISGEIVVWLQLEKNQLLGSTMIKLSHLNVNLIQQFGLFPHRFSQELYL